MSDASDDACADLESKLRHFDEATLAAMLCVLQSRLGTAGEAPGDFLHARAIAHRLGNLRTFRLAASPHRSA